MTRFDNWLCHNPADDPTPCDDCECDEVGCQYDHIPEECGRGQPDPDEAYDRMREEALCRGEA